MTQQQQMGNFCFDRQKKLVVFVAFPLFPLLFRSIEGHRKIGPQKFEVFVFVHFQRMKPITINLSMCKCVMLNIQKAGYFCFAKTIGQANNSYVVDIVSIRWNVKGQFGFLFI